MGGKKGSALVLQVLEAVLIAWIPAQLIYFSVQTIYPGPSESVAYLNTPLKIFTMLILLAPMLETYMMKYMFVFMGKVIKSPTKINVIAATAWGSMHWNSGSWGLYAVWAFFIMGICYMRLKERSTQHAVYIVMIMHAMFNGLSVGLDQALKYWTSVEALS